MANRRRNPFRAAAPVVILATGLALAAVGVAPGAVADDGTAVLASLDPATLPEVSALTPGDGSVPAGLHPHGGSGATASTASSSKPPQWSGFTTAVLFSGKQQETSTWCGVAATQGVLSTWGISVSQTTLSKSIGTGSLGSLPGKIEKTLNDRTHKGFYEVAKDTTGGKDLWKWMAKRIDAYGDVAEILVYSKKIWYPHAGSLEMHYLDITGYSADWNGKGKTWQVWDPADGGFHHLSLSDFAGASVDGVAILPVW